MNHQKQFQKIVQYLYQGGKHCEELFRSMQLIHQYDCIYFGEINKSYQKEGFGILQTLEFQMYFGFFKNNKADGLGLVIYPSGSIIYGYFNRDELHGLTIIENQEILRVGTCQGKLSKEKGIDFIGVAFQYHVAQKLWKMVFYEKGYPKKIMGEEQKSIQEGIPEFMNSEHSIYMFYKAYLFHQYFQYQNIIYFHKIPTSVPKNKKQQHLKKLEQQFSKYKHINENLINNPKKDFIFLCPKFEGLPLGLGCKYDRQSHFLLEAGFYHNNRLEGFCWKFIEQQLKLVGHFQEGNKNGPFLQMKKNIIVCKQYHNNIPSDLQQFTYQQFKKKQKAFNFEQKDYLSSKNTLKLGEIFEIFISAQIRHYQNTKKNKDLSPSESRVQPKENARSKKKNVKQNSYNYINQSNDKTSVNIMKQKLKNFEFKEEEQQKKSLENSNKKVVFQDSDEIASQENPFEAGILGFAVSLNDSPNKRQSYK